METSLTWLGRLAHNSSGPDWDYLDNVYSDLLTLWCGRAGVPASDRDDLVQEVLMVVVRRVTQFEHRHAGAFRGWLRAILANHLKRYFRERANCQCQLDLEQICDTDSALSRKLDLEHDEFIARRAMRIVQRDFSPNTWSAFYEQVLKGQSAIETAAALNISVNAAVKAKCRVLKRLRQELNRLVD